jgi:peroxiredoxin Q/BCP
VVIGISKDSPRAQSRFKEKLGLPFPLLSDVGGKVCEKFDVIKEKNMYGKKVKGIERSTFVIGTDGRIEKIYRKVKVDGHVANVLEDL